MAPSDTDADRRFKQIENHAEYYIRSGDLHLLVENVMFRVHAYFFERDSARFRAILSTPASPNLPRLGSSDSKPIIIQNSSPKEFAKFCWVFYNHTYSLYSASVSEWTSILKTACEYDFLQVQHFAIRGLQSCELSTVERIHIYELYKVDIKYLIPLYNELCIRDEAPSDQEVKHLGNETSLLIFRLREKIRSGVSDEEKSPLPAGIDEQDALQTICDFLGADSIYVVKSGTPSGVSSSSKDKGKRQPNEKNGSSKR